MMSDYFKCGRQGPRDHRDQYERHTPLPPHPGLENGKGQKSRNVGSLQGLEKARKGFTPKALERNTVLPTS